MISSLFLPAAIVVLSAQANAPITSDRKSDEVAEAAAAAPEATPAVLQKSRQLALLVAPIDMIIEANAENTRKSMATMAETDSTLKVLLSTYPGIDEAMYNALIPIVDQALIARHDDLVSRVSAIYVKTFTEAELDKILETYDSDLGRKIVALEYGSVDPMALFDEEDDSGDVPQISEDKAMSELNATSLKIFSGLTLEERRQVIAFNLTPAGQKFSKASMEVARETIDWTNTLVAETAPTTNAAIEQAVIKFIEEFDG
ncbi:MAG: DUF2059 domain-containing protein [Pseudomonadota bacterium]